MLGSIMIAINSIFIRRYPEIVNREQMWEGISSCMHIVRFDSYLSGQMRFLASYWIALTSAAKTLQSNYYKM